jgi:chromosome segregation ATPase
MAIRLKEEEVHIACAEIASQGERPTSLNLLDKLGRGSLTTITKYLNSWNKTDDAQALEAESLPAVVQLPSELSKEGEDLLKKMWNVAKNITDNELEIQREALKQAEVANQSKVEEAFKFSEAQAMKIERVEEDFISMKNQLVEKHREYKQAVDDLNDAEKINVGLSKDNDQLKYEISDLKKQIVSLEEKNKIANQDSQALQKDHANELKMKDTEIKSLDMQVHKLQAALELAVQSNDQLKVDIKDKESELSNRIIELEKVGVKHESSTNELKAIKTELKIANKIALDAEKQVAKLEGKLEVYKSLEKPKKETKDS